VPSLPEEHFERDPQELEERHQGRRPRQAQELSGEDAALDAASDLATESRIYR
jgi:hypothetical protein